MATQKYSWLRSPLFVLVAVLLICVGGWKYFSHRVQSTVGFRTAPVTSGDLFVSISATGTVEPEEVIDVGAQVAGLVLSFGKDKDGKPIDYGSNVEEGMVLAQIDDALYLLDVAQTEAETRRAQADLGQAKAKLSQAERDWVRAEKIGPSDALSQSAFDSYKAAFEVAKAGVLVAEAQIVQANAAFQKAKRNLGYTIIRSPVEGVIIDRRVNIGQTVVSSLNAPSLFLIAKDLRRMQVWVSVNEADIGSIKPGQPVRFTVDAFPGEEFRGEVGKVRLNASMSQNVVTYIVEVVTENSNLRLLPYLTANVRFEISNRENTLLVPNAALRWSPSTEQRLEAPEDTEAGSQLSTLWVPEGSKARAIRVKIEGTDGVNTAVGAPKVQAGLEVIIGDSDAKAPGVKTQTATNPFAPVMTGRGRKGGR